MDTTFEDENDAEATPTESTSYDESWPNLLKNDTPSPRHIISMETEQPILARYVHRFRTAPPTSRDCRQCHSNQSTAEDFWWISKKEADKSLRQPPKIVPQLPKRGSQVQYCSDAVLVQRSLEALKKSSRLLSAAATSPLPSVSCNSPTAKRDMTDSNQPSPTRKPHVQLNGDREEEEDDSFSKKKDDILYQWRLKRRLEEARREVVRGLRRERKSIPNPSTAIPSTIPPHVHLSCDIIPCPNCPSAHQDPPSSCHGNCHRPTLCEAKDKSFTSATEEEEGEDDEAPLTTRLTKERMLDTLVCQTIKDNLFA